MYSLYTNSVQYTVQINFSKSPIKIRSFSRFLILVTTSFLNKWIIHALPWYTTWLDFVHCIVYAVHCIVNICHCIMYICHCIVYICHCIVYATYVVDDVLIDAWSGNLISPSLAIVYIVHCIQCTVYSVYRIHCTVYSVHCTHCAMHKS